ncbi:hypothetical protein V1517DRAFT_324529 [Lipomyces orientalis]|uniref:Uncharacterized protein n=1 Tax=Lipomyces orientalis TaxID=1233043 RepID=A0ACC3TLM1_9ASCO
MPTNSEIEAVLVETVRAADFDTATLRSIRRDVVSKLGLPEDFFDDEWWKKKSAAITDLVMDELDPSDDPSQPQEIPAKRGPGRSKRQKTNEPSVAAPKKVKQVVNKSTAFEDVDGQIALRIAKHEHNITPVPVSEEPATDKQDVSTRRRQKPSHVTKKAPKSKKTSSKRRTTPKPEFDDPLEQKIATLKSWVVKCGVRKQWTRELAPFDTKQDKIAHLQRILQGLGMTPRYSLEKAKKIRERREMEAEVAQLRAEAGESSDNGNESDNEDNDLPGPHDPSKQKRKVVAGGFSIEFLGDQSSDSD